MRKTVRKTKHAHWAELTPPERRKDRKERRKNRKNVREERRQERETSWNRGLDSRREFRLDQKEKKLQRLHDDIRNHDGVLDIDRPTTPAEEQRPKAEQNLGNLDSLAPFLVPDESQSESQKPDTIGSEEKSKMTPPARRAVDLLAKHEKNQTDVRNDHPLMELLKKIGYGIIAAFKIQPQPDGSNEIVDDQGTPIATVGPEGEFFDPSTGKASDQPDPEDPEAVETANKKITLGILANWLEGANPDEVKYFAKKINEDLGDETAVDSTLLHPDKLRDTGGAIDFIQNEFRDNPDRFHPELGKHLMDYIANAPKAREVHKERVDTITASMYKLVTKNGSKEVKDNFSETELSKIRKVITILYPDAPAESLENPAFTNSKRPTWHGCH